MTLDVTAVRRQFPALQSETVFFDNPGGTQVPQAVLDRMLGYLTKSNANATAPLPPAASPIGCWRRAAAPWRLCSAPPGRRRSSSDPT